MTTINNYQIYCTSESQWVNTWGTTVPTTCANNTAHTVDSNSVQIVGALSSQTVNLNNEITPTGGHYQCCTKSFDINTLSTSSLTFSFPIPVNILDGWLTSVDNQKNDIVTVYLAPDTVIGVITSNVITSDTIINVSPTVISNAQIGYLINLTDGTNASTNSKIIAIDTVNSRITLEAAVGYNFSAATPTYVRMSIVYMESIELGPGAFMRFGAFKSYHAAYLPANTPMKIVYENNSQLTQHPVIFFEYLY